MRENLRCLIDLTEADTFEENLLFCNARPDNKEDAVTFWLYSITN